MKGTGTPPVPLAPARLASATPARPRAVVAVAASLGGIDALKTLLGALPPGFPAAVVVVQHLDAARVSTLHRALAPSTTLPVVTADGGERLREGTVYLAPSARHLRMEADGTLSLSDSPPEQGVRPSADPLFASLAEVYGARGIAVVLTGRLHDGSAGVLRVHGAGGSVLAQDHDSSLAFGMPGSAIRTGVVDQVLPLNQIAGALLALTAALVGPATDPVMDRMTEPMTRPDTQTEADPAFEALLEFVRKQRGTDLTGYKRSTLTRRVRRHMDEVGAPDYAAYQAHLSGNPQAFNDLFNTVLINVTDFWRDPEAWATLTGEYIPRILAAKGPNDAIRAWTAGCASGEETYTLVMALVEAMGEARFRDQVKVYATDLDDEALAQARLASYTAAQVESIPPALRERYFTEVGERFVFRNDLRRFIIFGRHDLVRDAPISHLDLLVSRNTLMYFNTETQGRILSRFHFALNDGGLLFLGKAEMMRAHGALFTPLDLPARIFQKVSRANLRDRLLMMGRPMRPAGQDRMARQLRLREAALDASAAAHLVVDLNGSLAVANEAARVLFGLGEGDLGRPLQDLTVSYRPVELRSQLEQVYATGAAVHLPSVEHPSPGGEIHQFDVTVSPLLEPEGKMVGIAISFTDVTPFHRLRAELQETNQELETAFEELQSTNEELETTNEELQSTNEELETLNEELQSTNEELETINYELERRTGELNHVNASMSSILTSLRVAVVVLDRGGSIRVWNRRAEDLWGLRGDEVEGHAFQNLDIGLPVERLKAPIRACMEGKAEHEELVLEAVNRRGRAVQCRVTCTPFLDPDGSTSGAVLVMDETREGAA